MKCDDRYGRRKGPVKEEGRERRMVLLRMSREPRTVSVVKDVLSKDVESMKGGTTG